MKAEYDLSKMKRRGHPLRNKAIRGEIKLTSVLDIPDKDKKLDGLDPDEREFVAELIKKRRSMKA